MDWTWLTSEAALIALAQVIVIDIVLAGDNAIVVGMAAAAVPVEQRARVIFWGLAAAVAMRIGFAAVTTQLLQIIGLTLAGGILLLWVSWRLYRELTSPGGEAEAASLEGEDTGIDEALAPKSTRAAITQIILADLSMSLDNVLAVAGAAMEHPEVLVIGLVLSVALMGAAAVVIARLLARYRWIGFIGLAIIAYVALDMIWRGGGEVVQQLGIL